MTTRAPTLQTTAKQFDLLNAINVRGPFLITQKSIPHLRRASNPHVLMIAPVPELRHISETEFPAYLISKYSMSLFTLAFANEFRADGIAFNALWPRTAIWTAAGAAIRGIRVNEDSFTIQLRDAAGRHHSFRKSELNSLARLEGQTPMPAYERRIAGADLDDLVAYLAGLKGKP